MQPPHKKMVQELNDHMVVLNKFISRSVSRPFFEIL